jgi:CPA2 family monovalent cation:H+ antiporter-2
MPHHTPLIATVVAGLVLAFIMGAIANRFRLPPLAGYLMAGVMIGPFTPGFVADQKLAPELAELGVILLMFGVGMHFSLRDLMSVKTIAIPGAIVQIGAATFLGMLLAWYMGWSTGAGVVFGLALSVASTVVLLRALQERRMIETERGRIAVGWLIVEDLAMVLALVLLPAFAGLMRESEGTAAPPSGLDVTLALVWTLGKVGALVVLMLVVGRRVIPQLLHHIAQTGSRELFRLAVLAIALGVAFGAAKLFGASFALGAFLAGMVLAESELSHRAAEESLPLRDAFAVLFFVSVGMLFDPAILVRDPLPVLATFLIIVVGKSVAALLIVLAFRHPARTALTIAASLAQIGEFSFILAALGLELGLLPVQGRDLIITGAILSILVNPLFFLALDRWQRRSEQKAAALAGVTPGLPEEDAKAPGATVLVGFGRVGSMVAAGLREEGVSPLVIEERPKLADLAKSGGFETLVGNAAVPGLMRAGQLAETERIFVAIPNAFEAGQIVEQARRKNPGIEIVARAHSDAESAHLRQCGADLIVLGEREIAKGMLELALRKTLGHDFGSSATPLPPEPEFGPISIQERLDPD